MNREIYEQMAEGLASQLKDLLSGATYEQKDSFIDCLDALMMDTSSDHAAAELSAVMLDIYRSRFEDEEGETELMNLSELSLGKPAGMGDAEYDSDDFEISEDDFLFSI